MTYEITATPIIDMAVGLSRASSDTPPWESECIAISIFAFDGPHVYDMEKMRAASYGAEMIVLALAATPEGQWPQMLVTIVDYIKRGVIETQAQLDEEGL
jgi:hypothetical protein